MNAFDECINAFHNYITVTGNYVGTDPGRYGGALGLELFLNGETLLVLRADKTERDRAGAKAMAANSHGLRLHQPSRDARRERASNAL